MIARFAAHFRRESALAADLVSHSIVLSIPDALFDNLIGTGQDCCWYLQSDFLRDF